MDNFPPIVCEYMYGILEGQSLPIQEAAERDLQVTVAVRAGFNFIRR